MLRKKFVILTPEEWVRQNCAKYLVEEYKISQQLMSEEKQVMVNGMSKRYDLIVYKNDGSILLIVECKAPEIEINQETFDQIARYNLSLDADYLMLTNGFNHYFCRLDYVNKTYVFLPELPLKNQ